MAERFVKAAKDGYVDLLREATRKDLNVPDEDGMTATLWAAATGNLEALRLIVGRGGDVDKADYLGFTALHHAVHRGHMGVVSYLVNWGCNIYALDNDLHSALDLASISDRTEMVRYLDSELARRQTKNPRQVSKLKEEAIKAAESNIKRYEKLQKSAVERAEKEQKKIQKEIEGGTYKENRPRKSIFESLTMRMKGQPGNSFHKATGTQKQYSQFSGTSSAGSKLFDKKLQSKRLESMSQYSESRQSHGYMGPTSDIRYMPGNQGTVELGDGRNNRRPTLSSDIFQNFGVSRAKSESDLLEEFGEDGGLGDEVEEMGRFNLGKRTFLPKMPFIHPIHSFDDSIVSPTDEPGDDPRLSRDDVFYNNNNDPESKLSPWDQEDLDNLDDDEEESDDEVSTVNMFLWSCGVASWLHVFAQEKIDMALLTKMTDEELKDLGIPFGPRKKLREAIQRRNATMETLSRMSDTFL